METEQVKYWGGEIIKLDGGTYTLSTKETKEGEENYMQSKITKIADAPKPKMNFLERLKFLFRG